MRASHLLALAAVVCAACVGSAWASPSARGALTLRVRSHDVDWGRLGAEGAQRRRRLLRNATLPLHGAVKDFG